MKLMLYNRKESAEGYQLYALPEPFPLHLTRFIREQVPPVRGKGYYSLKLIH